MQIIRVRSCETCTRSPDTKYRARTSVPSFCNQCSNRPNHGFICKLTFCNTFLTFREWKRTFWNQCYHSYLAHLQHMLEILRHLCLLSRFFYASHLFLVIFFVGTAYFCFVFLYYLHYHLFFSSILYNYCNGCVRCDLPYAGTARPYCFSSQITRTSCS